VEKNTKFSICCQIEVFSNTTWARKSHPSRNRSKIRRYDYNERFDPNGPEAIKSFLAAAGNIKLSMDKTQRYAWIGRVLKCTYYFTLRKKGESVIRKYFMRGSGYSSTQMTRLIHQYKVRRWIRKKTVARNAFPKRYTNEDVLLLVKTDEVHQQLSGSTTKKLFERAYRVYANEEYKRLSTTSIAHIYNLRKSIFYQRQRRHFSKT
jgi:hypothetical protein